MVYPPSLPQGDLLRSSTYHHAPPLVGPVILGVDEAGRGPVLGPMVYAVAYCSAAYKEDLAALGFDDSKALTAERREELLRHMVEDASAAASIGWATTVMTAADISRGMLRPDLAYNLNAQAHDTTMALIQQVLDAGVELAEVYVDTVGPEGAYQAKLSNRFPGIAFTVTKKADSLFPIVSCASICAKVTRDASLEQQLTACGSGYPGDPATKAWLRANMDPLFGWGPLVRYSWSTAEDMLNRSGHAVEWAPDQTQIFDEPVLHPRGLPTIGLDWFGRAEEVAAE